MNNAQRLASEVAGRDSSARAAPSLRVGVVTATAPLSVDIDGTVFDALNRLSSYTPVIGHVVEVGVIRGDTSVQYVVHDRIV